MKLQDTTYARDGRSLLEVTRALADGGWEAQATPLEGGRLRDEAAGVEVDAAGVVVDSLARVEGASDPDDMAVVAGVTFPGTGTRATLVLQYGPEASAADADVLAALPDAEAPRQ